MKNGNFTDCCKNAVGTMFLLAGAFFVCSTFVSMRSVLADPIAPADTRATLDTATGSARTGATSRTGRASPRGQATVRNSNIARTTSNTTSRANAATTTRGVSGRNVVSRASAQNTVSRANAASASGRAVVARTTRNQNTVSRTPGVSGRTVVSRTAVAPAQNVSRISLQGNAIRGSKVSAQNTYTYLSSKLYTGNYSNIIDSTTGLISADAYSNCLESYYTCMDEICTARNASQGRCACAYRTKAFQEAENALTTANEELIKVSGELALLVATGGKDVSAAFQLTDAEKVMNCVSWQEMAAKYNGGYKWVENGEYVNTKSSTSMDADKYWCSSHNLYQNCSANTQPSYCAASGNNFGFDLKNIEGSSSDILASLQAWADAKENAVSMVISDNTSLLGAASLIMDVATGLGYDITGTESSKSLDNLANTWGYELFQYAHNNVCGRVLDSCFNGIFEACGNPPSGGRCANGATSSCPYNYNSNISVSNAGDVVLNERGSSTASTTSTSATCFGYTSTSGDPYSALRGPVADARRSVMQKYLLDANAACDAYGERLRTTAQNIGYQKIAAQQALQQKRMEFANNDAAQISSDYRVARANFNECLSELYECYTTQAQSNSSWSTSRIKTYCQQVANVPHCYETMVCDAPNSKLAAVITQDAGVVNCNNSEEYKDNNCRNVVTLNEILSDSYVAGEPNSSSNMREICLQTKASIEGVRKWTANRDNSDTAWAVQCNVGFHAENGECLANKQPCSTDYSVEAYKYWDSESNDGKGAYGACKVEKCIDGYRANDTKCEPVAGFKRTCWAANAKTAYQTYDDDVKWTGPCIIETCATGYFLTSGNKCIVEQKSGCATLPQYATAGHQQAQLDGTYKCVVDACPAGFTKSTTACTCTGDNHIDTTTNTCVSNTRTCQITNGAGAQTYNTSTNTWGTCTVESCNSGYKTSGNSCVLETPPTETPASENPLS